MNESKGKVLEYKLGKIIESIENLDTDEKIEAINEIKSKLHDISPFKNEPVDCVLWVKNDAVHANDYNPNSVAPPEMELLRLSIATDGYTQPIVTMDEGDSREVIDGFHRNRVGKECQDINSRVHGYLPVVSINDEQKGKNDRIASTIRHNRARGKHNVDSMSDIILELKNRNWKNSRIAKELGMDEDEILRLCQVTGLSGLFSDDDFSRSWDVENSYQDEEFEPIDEEEIKNNEIEVRTVNTSDSNRVFHTFDKWECHKAGFYASSKSGMSKSECEQAYADFLSDTDRFALVLNKVIHEWSKSCEHYLTNSSMNRIAWLGQASVCYDTGVPSSCSSGFFLLTDDQQKEANETALIYLNIWLSSRGMNELTIDEAIPTRQSTIY